MTMILEENMMVPMRDGVRLATDVFRPDGPGRYPVLLTRLPYNKSLAFPHTPTRRLYIELSFDLERIIAAGYVVAIQDSRGCYASEGTFTPVADEAADGFDAVIWAATQPWSSGVVGMFGESYQGLTQLQAARERPAALRAIVPMHAPYGERTFYPYQGGAFRPATFLGVTVTQFAQGELQRRVALGRARPEALAALADADLDGLLGRLPLADQPLLADLAPYYAAWLADPEGAAAADHAGRRALYPQVTVPALLIGGWYDYFLDDTLAHYCGLRDHGGSPAARRPRLIVGPWTHVDAPGMFGERDYGPQASTQAIDLTGMHLRWFDHHLKGRANGTDRELPVQIFVMGIDRWQIEEDWPPPDVQYRRYYLHSAGQANTADGDGWLSPEPPADEPADRFTTDPRNPLPTVGGAFMQPTAEGVFNTGPRDQRAVEARPDVLCYSTAPLERPVMVIGPVAAQVYLASSARDTDLTAKLVDVYPDGRAEILADGIIRARYRDSLIAPELLEPGRVYHLEIAVGATANVFRAGHRIRLEIAGGNFPRFERNPQHGGAIAQAGEADLRSATNSIYHDRERASHLLLPIVERSAADR